MTEYFEIKTRITEENLDEIFGDTQLTDIRRDTISDLFGLLGYVTVEPVNDDDGAVLYIVEYKWDG